LVPDPVTKRQALDRKTFISDFPGEFFLL